MSSCTADVKPIFFGKSAFKISTGETDEGWYALQWSLTEQTRQHALAFPLDGASGVAARGLAVRLTLRALSPVLRNRNFKQSAPWNFLLG